MFDRCSQHAKKWKTMAIWTNIFVFIALSNYVLLTVVSLLYAFLNTPITAIGILQTAILLTIIFFQCIHCWFGLFHDNIYEIYAIIASQTFITIVAVATVCNSYFRKVSLETSDWLLLAYGMVYFLTYLGFSYPLHQEYSWVFFKKAGAEPSFRAKYRRYLRFQVLLKMQLMMVLVNALVFASLVISVKSHTTGYVITGIAIPGALIWFVLGRMGIATESKILMGLFYLGTPLLTAFVSFTVYAVTTYVLIPVIDSPTKDDEQVITLTLFFVTSFFCAILHLAALWLSYLVFQDFGQGVKDIEYHQYEPTPTEDPDQPSFKPKNKNADLFNEVFKNTEKHTYLDSSSHSDDVFH